MQLGQPSNGGAQSFSLVPCSLHQPCYHPQDLVGMGHRLHPSSAGGSEFLEFKEFKEFLEFLEGLECLEVLEVLEF